MILTPAQYQRMTDYLGKLYGRDLYRRNGVVYPLRIFEPNDEQVNDVDSLLGDPPTQMLGVDDCFFYNYAYLQDMQNSGRNVFNGITFTYKGLRVNPLKITAYYGRYYDMLATCAALQDEFEATLQSSLIRLPMRTQFHLGMEHRQSMINGRGRSATIGGAVLIVCQHEGQYKALLARRSLRAAIDPGFFHVLPAFIFQPARMPMHPDEWRFSYHVYREYLEELFGMPEMDSDAPHDHFYQHPAFLDLQAMMQDGRASLHATAISINVITLRPEICALLLIRDETWYERVTAPDSLIPLDVATEAKDGKLEFVPIATDKELLAALPPDVHTIMPPHALAAVWHGVDLARRLLG